MMYKKFIELVYHKQSLRKVIFSIISADITCFHMPSHNFMHLYIFTCAILILFNQKTGFQLGLGGIEIQYYDYCQQKDCDYC